jgi:hypothetical protein
MRPMVRSCRPEGRRNRRNLFNIVTVGFDSSRHGVGSLPSGSGFIFIKGGNSPEVSMFRIRNPNHAARHDETDLKQYVGSNKSEKRDRSHHAIQG